MSRDPCPWQTSFRYITTNWLINSREREIERGRDRIWKAEEETNINIVLGKTSLAAKLAATLGLVHLEIDAILTSDAHKNSEIGKEVLSIQPLSISRQLIGPFVNIHFARSKHF